VFLNKTSFTRFTRKERLEKNDLEGCLSPKLRIYIVVFINYNIISVIYSKNQIMIRVVCLFLCLVFSAGCATQYRYSYWKGGYSETHLDENMYKVYFKGNGYTSRQSSDEMCLLRCAELCLEAGYTYFVVVEAEQKTRTSTYTTPTRTRTNATLNGSTRANATLSGNSVYANSNTSERLSANTITTGGQTRTISKPGQVNTIVLINEKPNTGDSYNAKFIFNSLSKKYIK